MHEHTKTLRTNATRLRTSATQLSTETKLNTEPQLNITTRLRAITNELKEKFTPFRASEDALFAAARKGDIDGFNACVKHGIDPHSVEKQTGNNAAHYAAEYNQVDMFAYISKIRGLKSSFMPNKVNYDGDTYLHIAAAKGHREMAHYLINKYSIDYPIDLTIENFQSWTAEELARNNKHYIIADDLASWARNVRAAEEKEKNEAREVRAAAEKERHGAQNISQLSRNQITITPEIPAAKPKDSVPGKLIKLLQERRKKSAPTIAQPRQEQQKHVSKIWDDLSFTPNTPGELQNILQSSDEATYIHLNLSNLGKAKYTSLNLSKLRNLGLSRAPETFIKADLLKIIDKFPDLTALEFGNHLLVSEACLTIIANNMLKLTSLGLVNWYIPIEIIANNLPNLTSLRLPAGYYRKTPDIDNGELSSEEHYNNMVTPLSRKDILQITKLRNLTSLDIGFYGKITDADIEQITINLQKLTSLNLSCCLSIGDAGIKSIATNLPGLISLNLSNCHDVTERGINIISTMRNLTSLNLRNCGILTKAGITSIANNMPQLEKLTLGNVGNKDHIIDEALLKNIATKMPKLTYFDVSGWHLFTDDILKIIAKKMPDLTCLNLSHCPEITNAGIKHLAKMTKLRHLNCNMEAFIILGKTPGITNDALSKLKLSLPDTNIIGINGQKIYPQARIDPQHTYGLYVEKEGHRDRSNFRR